MNDETSTEDKFTLLAVMAHPDDETFGIGGTLALYAKRGVTVHLIYATRGEAGEVDEKYLKEGRSIAELRESELQCAANALGLASVSYLGYRDSGMNGSIDNLYEQALINIPEEELVKSIVIKIRKVKPQVIITFDPMGGYLHPDHICVHNATNKAFIASGDYDYLTGELHPYKPQKLYYYTISRTIMRWLVRSMPLFCKNPRRYGQNGDIDLKAIAEADIPIHARINYREVADIRAKASNCYLSQGGQKVNQGAAGLLRGWAISHEVFMRGYPAPVGNQIETDLFDGVLPE